MIIVEERSEARIPPLHSITITLSANEVNYIKRFACLHPNAHNIPLPTEIHKITGSDTAWNLIAAIQKVSL